MRSRLIFKRFPLTPFYFYPSKSGTNCWYHEYCLHHFLPSTTITIIVASLITAQNTIIAVINLFVINQPSPSNKPKCIVVLSNLYTFDFIFY